MNNIEELKKNLLRYMTDAGRDFCNDWSASDSSYICDAIMEASDGAVDIYYSGRAKWFAENWEVVDDAITEFGKADDIMQDIAQAQYLQASNNIYSDLDSIILFLGCEYLEDNGINELNDEQLEIFENLTCEIDNNNRLEDIAEYINENILTKEEAGAESCEK